MVSQLPEKIELAASTWLESKGSDPDISDEDGRAFMVKIRTLLIEKGMPTDGGWRGSELQRVSQVNETMSTDEAATVIIPHSLSKASAVEGNDLEGRKPEGINAASYSGTKRGGYPRDGKRARDFRCYICRQEGHGWRSCAQRTCNKAPVDIEGYVDVEIEIAGEIPVMTRVKVLDSEEQTLLLGREFLISLDE